MRFTVGGVTGYSIGRGSYFSGRSREAPTMWYVHDSAYGFQVVQEFIGPGAEESARKLAAELNGQTYKPALAADDPRHGTKNGYKNLGCRCSRCRAGWAAYHRAYTHRKGLRKPRKAA